MRKSKTYISSIIIFSLLLGFLATTSADAVTDFSGNYNGNWYCEIHRYGGELSINLTQNATIVSGTLSMRGWGYVLQNWGITGTITGDVLSFKATGNSDGYYFVFDVSLALLTGNQLSGGFQIYRDGALYCMGPFNVTRPTIIPSGYIINASAGTGGVIFPAGNVSVNAGTNQTFHILANECYKILDVIVDGVSVGAKNSYTFNSVSANHTIMAIFKKVPKSMPWLQLLLDE